MRKDVPRKIWNSLASSRDPEVQTPWKRPVDAPNQKPVGSVFSHNCDRRDEAYNLTSRLSSHVNGVSTWDPHGFSTPHEEGQMTRKLWFLAVLFVALVTLGAGPASAQAVDARKAIEAAAKAMGTTNLKSIQFTGD